MTASQKMKVGIVMFATDEAITITELARACEERGFESLFVPEHSHIPVSRQSPWPGGPELPRFYLRTLDPFVALAAAAAVTTTLQLGTGVALVVQRDPIHLAKEVASLDHLSGGRVLLGVGGGWNREEMADHGTDPKTRWDVLRERVLACKEIWTKDEAEYHGEFVNFDPLWAWPKPVRQPPVLIGGDGAGAFDRVLDYGDGWMPINRFPPGRFAARVTELQKTAADRGRGPVPVTMFGGKATEEAVHEYAELGLERNLFIVPPAGADTVLPELDKLAKLADLVR
ncbi:MAG TPA: LLM class F420-dependent oxidoreductase [Sporichthyaceae bacterium]|nr:LLM class F420-dependent oxidoreductase [Sporichthyaceae bacterium]